MLTTEEPNINKTGRYNVCKAAELLGVSRKTINRWSLAGLIKPSRRKGTSRIYYTGETLLNFWKSSIY